MTMDQIENAAINCTGQLAAEDLVTTKRTLRHAVLTYRHPWPDYQDARAWHGISRVVDAHARTLAADGLHVEIYACGGWMISDVEPCEVVA